MKVEIWSMQAYSLNGNPPFIHNQPKWNPSPLDRMGGERSEERSKWKAKSE